MKHLLTALALPVMLALPLTATAGPKADALSACLGDSTTGKDRKDLARWIFIAISSHPEIKPLSSVTDATRVEADKGMAALLTTLLAERCQVQAREAVQAEGSTGMVTAFQALGGLAMKELMTNGEVNKGISGFEKYLDRAKLDAALGGTK